MKLDLVMCKFVTFVGVAPYLRFACKRPVSI